MTPARLISIKLACLALSVATARADDAAVLPGTRQYWGAQTNGLKAGLCFQFAPDSTNQVQIIFVPAILNASTNNHSPPFPNVLILSIPPFGNRYKMDLTDAVGRPVQKTRKGQALGKPYVEPPLTGVHFHWPPGCPELFLKVNQPAPLYEVTMRPEATWHWLSLPDYFKIRKPGSYRFTLQMSILFWENGNPLHLRLTALPPVEADLDLQLPPKPPSLLATFAKAYGVDVLGYALCFAGIIWLVARRRARKPQPS